MRPVHTVEMARGRGNLDAEELGRLLDEQAGLDFVRLVPAAASHAMPSGSPAAPAAPTCSRSFPVRGRKPLAGCGR